ncbi:hypothetical protein AAFC00_001372 [Neodothiora populina]|uniref:tRNA (adenine(58)-N(1))-methyltransferase catalytic subunit TRM61 n=1 Tax=Neodothiora populina TaxID=2781224 RepID=A0ABR3PNR1_9PEZI
MNLSLSTAGRISAHLPRPHNRISLRTSRRTYASAFSPFAENDLVLVRPKADPSATPILTKPLTADRRIETHRGTVSHNDIIGKSSRDLVRSSSGAEFSLHHVSLGEYVTLSKRLVTPIYPADANLIASLFDIHVSPAAASADAEPSQSRLEILEAGTGHGSLTLHLSRAIHAANPPKPEQSSVDSQASTTAGETSASGATAGISESDDALSAWRASRRAVLHTIDVSAKFSQHARKVVRGFRHGRYADNVDFHVGDVSQWVRDEFARRASSTQSSGDGSDSSPTPFLTHAFLDLPSTHSHLATVASALRTDGILIIFNPSITQIAECMQKIKQEGIPLHLDQTLELGQNGTSGGREWDVRAVKPRAALKKEQAQVPISETGESESSSSEKEPVAASANTNDDNWALVCRPKVGDRITGGGFLGVFRKMKDRTRTVPPA